MEMIKTEQYREAAAYLASRIEGNPETSFFYKIQVSKCLYFHL